MSAPQPAPPPARVVLDGRYVRLEPVGPQHADDLFVAATPPDALERFAYLPSMPPRLRRDRADLDRVAAGPRRPDPLRRLSTRRPAGQEAGSN